MARDGSLTLFRVRGVPIKAHWTLLLVIPYLAVALSQQFDAIAILAGVAPDHLAVRPAVWGLLIAIGLFASVAIHELAHAQIATRYGVRVRSITLMLLGGASALSRSPQRPLHEALMAIAGPIASLVLGFACAASYALFDLAPDWQMSLFYLATINIALGLFNMLPAFPMDGGRILRALLAARLGRPRATEIAVAIGKLCAVTLGIFAIAQLRLSLGLVALYVYVSAASELVSEQICDWLVPLSVTDLLSRAPAPVIDGSAGLSTAAQRLTELQRLELVVVGASGPIAIVDADDVARLGAAHAGGSLAALAPLLPARFVVVPKGETANGALTIAAERDAPYVVVVEPQGTVIGLVGPRDIERTIRLRAMRGNPPHEVAA
jgi:Zn-dependent protease